MCHVVQSNLLTQTNSGMKGQEERCDAPVCCAIFSSLKSSPAEPRAPPAPRVATRSATIINMARALGCVGSYAVCCFVFLLLVSTVDSRQNADFHVEYLIGSRSSNIQYTIRSLPDDSLHRYRRQAGASPAINSSTSSSNSTFFNTTADETTVAHTTHNFSTPSLTSSSTASTNTNITTTITTSPTTSATATNTSNTTTKVTTTTSLRTSTTSSSKESTTTTPQTTIKKDNHNYYISVIRPDSSKSYFTELLSPTTQETLSSGHRVAVAYQQGNYDVTRFYISWFSTVALPFKFRFYGHNISNITIATGGFIYTSPFLHQWLTATQYIAPLMANFDTSTTQDSEVLYKQVDDEFIVEWRNVLLKDQNSTGPFIFQAKLKNDGTITFVYLKLPVPVTNISTINHPVKIGLSDAFYNDTFIPQYGIKRRTIYEYHRVSFMPEQIEEGTVIVLEPLPTCNIIEDCRTCTEHVNVNFDCKWCEKVSRCSDGLDWNRQNWIEQGCTNLALIHSSWCGDLERTSPTTTASASSSNIQTDTHTQQTTSPIKMTYHSTTSSHIETVTSEECGQTQSSKCEKEKSTNVAAIVAVVLILVLLFGGVGLWLLYAYTHPTSSSGIWLMEHRPSQMKARIANMKFWKSSTPNGTKYQVETEA